MTDKRPLAALAVLAVLLAARPARAAVCTWTGGTGDYNWYTPSNWNTPGCPGTAPGGTMAANSFVVDMTTFVFVAVSSPALEYAALTLGDAAGTFSPLLKLSTAVNNGGPTTIGKTATLVFDSLSISSFTSLTLLNGSSVTHTGPNVNFTAAVNLYVAGTLDIQAGSKIGVTGLGYAGGNPGSPGFGPGFCPGGNGAIANASGAGAGHGGAGGIGAGGVTGVGGVDTSDTVYLAGDYGCGGGGGAVGTGTSTGSAGGGYVNIFASTVNLNGAILADAGVGGSGTSGGGGGGAGGGINVLTANLNGSGTLSAGGGAGGSPGGGGGGGGRITVRVTGANMSSSITAFNATGGIGQGAAGSGQTGTLFVNPAQWFGGGFTNNASEFSNWYGTGPISGNDVVVGRFNVSKNMTWDVSTPLTLSSFTITSAYTGVVGFSAPVTVAGPMTMAAGTLGFNAASMVLSLAGNLSQTGGVFTITQGTVALTGSAPQTLSVAPTATLFNLTAVASASATVVSNLLVAGDLTVSTGASLSFAPGVTATLDGNFSHLGAGGGAAAAFVANGTGIQNFNAPSAVLGSLRVANTARVVLSTNPFTLASDLLIDAGAALNATGANIFLGGNWNNLGSVTPNGSVVSFASASQPQTILAGGAFENLTVNATGQIVTAATPLLITSTLTVLNGTLALGASTHTVQGGIRQTGGSILGGSGEVLLNGASRQMVSTLPSSLFNNFVASNTAGASPSVTMIGTATIGGVLETDRGALNLPGTYLTLKGDLTWRSSSAPPAWNTAGSTVVFSGGAPQNITLKAPGNALSSVVIDNPSPGGVRLGGDLMVTGNFTVSPTRTFDGGGYAFNTTLTLTGSSVAWTTAGANYLSAANGRHLVVFQSSGSGITVSSGSYVNATVEISTGGAVAVGGYWTIGGFGNALNPLPGSVLDARGSTITLRDTVELSPSAGQNWTYLHDANSWIVYQGTGAPGARGVGISSNTLGSLRVSLAGAGDQFFHPDLNLDGNVVIDQGLFRPGCVPTCNKTLSLKGSFINGGGSVDYLTPATGTIRMNGGPAAQAISVLPFDSLAALRIDAATATALSPLILRGAGGGDFTLTAGVFNAGNFTHEFDGNIALGTSAAINPQSSTITLNGSSLGRTLQSVVFGSTGAFNGLTVNVATVVFGGSFVAGVFTDNVANGRLYFSTYGVAGVAALNLNGGSPATPVRLLPAAPNAPWSLQLTGAPAIFSVFVASSNAFPAGCTAASCLVAHANDGTSTDGGGNLNWNFEPFLVLLAPGEAFTPGVAPGKAGAPSAQTAGNPFTVQVKAISSLYAPVSAVSLPVYLNTPNDPFAVFPATTVMPGGSIGLTVTLREAEPSPFPSIVAVNSGQAFLGGTSLVPVKPAAFASLVALVPGESPAPGSPTGRGGVALAQVSGFPFSVTVRATDPFFNLITGAADGVQVSRSPAYASNLPLGGTLAAGTAVVPGIVVTSTGIFTLAAADTANGLITTAISSTFSVVIVSVSSPTAVFAVPNGSTVTTLNGALSGTAADAAVVNTVLVAIKDLATGLYLSFPAQAFAAGTAPLYGAAFLSPPLAPATVWTLPVGDSLLTSGRQYLVDFKAFDPTGLSILSYSTFTFNPNLLVFGPTDGKGSAVAAPSAAAGCQTQTFSVTYTVGGAGLAAGGAVALRVPPGWTVPVGVSGAVPPPPGYVSVVSTSLASVVLGSTQVAVNPASFGGTSLGSGWVLLQVSPSAVAAFNPGENVVFNYSGLPPLGAPGIGAQTFDLRSQGSATGSLIPISSPPSLVLTAGTTGAISFTDFSPLTLGPLQSAPTMQLRLTDLCGNPLISTQAVVASLSAGSFSPSGFAPDPGVAFYLAGAGSTGTVTIPAGLTVSTSFYFVTSTAALGFETLRATATVAPAGNPSESDRLVALAPSALALTGISIDTGTLTPGSTTVALTAGSAANTAYVHFTLANAGIPWDVTISTDTAMFYPPVFQAYGFGDPARSQSVSWNGINTSAAPAQFVPPGLYHVRLRAGGGAASDLSLSAAVQPSASIFGTVGAGGAGALVSAVGPGAGFGNFASAGMGGAFQIFGLLAGRSYDVFATTRTVAMGQSVALTASAYGVAATTAGTNAGALSFPATSFLQVSVSLPTPAPQELWGGVFAHNADYSSTGFGSLHYPAGVSSSDNGAMSFGLSASTWTLFALAPDTYTLEISVPLLGLSTVTAGRYVAPGAATSVPLVLNRRANVYGFVVLPSTTQFGAWVSVQALKQGAAAPAAFGGAFVPPVAVASAAYSLFGLESGAWTISARSPGFSPASAGVVVAGSGDVGTPGAPNGLNLALGLGGVVQGTVTVAGNTLASTPCAGTCPPGTYTLFVRAYNPATFDSVSIPVLMPQSSTTAASPFTLSGLSTGTYFLQPSLQGFQSPSAQGVPVSVSAAGVSTAALTLTADNSRLIVNIAIPPPPGGVCHSTVDFRSVGAFLTIPSGGSIVAVAAGGSVAVADITAGATAPLTSNTYWNPGDGTQETFYCSSMTYTSPALNPGSARFGAVYGPTGAWQVKTAQLSNQSDSALLIDLTGSTFTVSGSVSVLGAVTLSSATAAGGTSVTVSSAPGLLAQSAVTGYCLLTSSSAVSTTTFRMEMVPFDPLNPSPAQLMSAPSLVPGVCRVLSIPGSTGLPSLIAAIGAINADGSFQIGNVPAGTYVLRNVPNLDLNPAVDKEIASFQAVVQVTSSVSGVSVKLSPGARIGGTVYLPPGLSLSRPMSLSLLDVYGNVQKTLALTFAKSNGVAYVLDHVADGRYSIMVNDLGFPRAYLAPPLIVVVAGADQTLQDIHLQAGGYIKARLAVQQTLSDGSRQFTFISQRNANLLPPGFAVDAIADPWFQGGFFQARGLACGPSGCTGAVTIDSNGQVAIEDILPGVYDVEFAVPNNPAAAASGAGPLVSAMKAGIRVASGQTVDLGLVDLVAGTTLSGLVVDAATGAGIPSIPMVARPSVKQPGQDSARRPLPQTVTNPDGSYSLSGLDPTVRFYDVVAAFRGGERQGDPKPPYEQKAVLAVDLQSTTTLNLSLAPAPFSISGQVVGVAGQPLQSSVGQGQGNQPGATIGVQKADAIPILNPVADILLTTDGNGNFTVPSLASGTYRIFVTASNYASLSFTATIAAAPLNLGVLSLGSGAALSGSLTKPDGFAPGQDEAQLIMAATPDLADFFLGSVTLDPITRMVTGYNVSGFRPNLPYRILIVGQNEELIAPEEASNVVFASSADVRRLDIVLRRSKPFVLAKSRSSGGNFLLDFEMSQPLRSRSASDGDPTVIVTTVSALGSLSGMTISDSRTKLSAVYTPGFASPGVLESSFTLRVHGYSVVRDPDSIDPVNPEFTLDALTTFFVGLDGLNRTSVNNLDGGSLLIEGDTGRVTLPRGSFNLDASSSVVVTMQKSAEPLATLNPSSYGSQARWRGMRYAPAAYPRDFFRAMAATPPQISPFSAFYDILLPLGVRTALARPVQMCVAYAKGADPSALNLYWYNQAANAYILQQDVIGAPPVVDAVNRVKCIHVNHFSTFVLFNTGVDVISGGGFTAADPEVFNFPNPFDLSVKTVTPIHGAPPQTLQGTLIRFGLPPGASGAGSIDIFNVAGERVRRIDLGSINGGNYYYQPWDGRNDAGRSAASGVYVGELKVGGLTKFFKMVLIK